MSIPQDGQIVMDLLVSRYRKSMNISVRRPAQAHRQEEERSMRILMLGNSFTFFNDMPEMVREITGAQVASHTRGGAWLSEQLNADTEMGAATLKALEEHWDYVVLQEYSNGPVKNREAFMRSAAELCAKIRACGGTPVLYATWAYEKNGPKMAGMDCSYEEMAQGLKEAYHAAAEENGALVADVGQRFFEQAEEKCLYNRDSYHPSEEGSRLAARTLSEVILADLAKRTQA